LKTYILGNLAANNICDGDAPDAATSIMVNLATDNINLVCDIVMST
jgi:hypothetical protein